MESNLISRRLALESATPIRRPHKSDESLASAGHCVFQVLSAAVIDDCDLV